MFTAVDSVQKLSLMIRIHPSGYEHASGYRSLDYSHQRRLEQYAWLERVLADLSGVPKIKNLGVTITFAHILRRSHKYLNGQEELDHVLRTFHDFTCSGTITMAIRMGGLEFPLDSTEYWQMLFKVGGVDMTMKRLTNSRQLGLKGLADATEALLQKKKQRDSLQESQLRQGDDAAPQLGNLDKLVSEAEDDVGMWERRIRWCERTWASLQHEAEAQIGDNWSLVVAT